MAATIVHLHTQGQPVLPERAIAYWNWISGNACIKTHHLCHMACASRIDKAKGIKISHLGNTERVL